MTGVVNAQGITPAQLGAVIAANPAAIAPIVAAVAANLGAVIPGGDGAGVSSIAGEAGALSAAQLKDLLDIQYSGRFPASFPHWTSHSATAAWNGCRWWRGLNAGIAGYSVRSCSRSGLKFRQQRQQRCPGGSAFHRHGSDPASAGRCDQCFQHHVSRNKRFGQS